VCLNKFLKPPNFIGVFCGFSVGNVFGFEDIGTPFFEAAKVRKKLLSAQENKKILPLLNGKRVRQKQTHPLSSKSNHQDKA